jgi:hypothetical protein
LITLINSLPAKIIQLILFSNIYIFKKYKYKINF